jgi:hypothetical protein
MKDKTIFYRLYRKCAYAARRNTVKKSKPQNALNTQKREQKIIVSMTSYPARFHCIHIALKSIMLQTVKPDRIIVWLDEDVSRNSYTKEMTELEKYGVEYRNAPGDLKPHKKYIHAMQEYPDDIIITVDDDLIYSADLIKSLMKTHEKYPDAVCARRVHKIIKNKNSDIASYNEWIGEYTGSSKPSHDLIATGVGGVLYPPHCLDKRTFDIEKICELSLKADDIWLKFMELLSGTKVVFAPCAIPMPQLIEKEQSSNLRSENVSQNMNDVYFQNVMKYFDLKPDIFWKD